MKNLLKNKISLTAIIILSLFINACKKDNPPAGEAATKATFKLEFEHEFGDGTEPFALNKYFVHPTTNDSLSFTTLKYYVSNIKIKKTDGTWWSQPESYYIVNLSAPASLVIEIKDVPIASYTELTYTLGVDSVKNFSGAQTGALSTINDMFWSWNSGYIMVKAEGNSPNSSTKDFAYHLGGYMAPNNIVTVKTTNFDGQIMDIKSNAIPQVHLLCNVASLWKTTTRLAAVSKIMMPGANANKAAASFYSDFVFDHLHQ